MAEMQKLLRMPVEPRHIKVLTTPIFKGVILFQLCVVFKMENQSKSDYRIFHVKTVEGPNDFATMEEVIYRRYKRMLDEGENLPN